MWELEGNGIALRSVALGHAYPAVLAAAIREMRRGANFTRPSPLEGECAEHLLEFVPGAEMAKFTKDGSAATTAAVRLARAYTGRDTVALCADHAFYSYDDWARQSVRHRWMLAYRGKQVVRRSCFVTTILRAWRPYLQLIRTSNPRTDFFRLSASCRHRRSATKPVYWSQNSRRFRCPQVDS